MMHGTINIKYKSDLRHYNAEAMTPNKLPQITAIYTHTNYAPQNKLEHLTLECGVAEFRVRL